MYDSSSDNASMLPWLTRRHAHLRDKLRPPVRRRSRRGNVPVGFYPEALIIGALYLLALANGVRVLLTDWAG